MRCCNNAIDSGVHSASVSMLGWTTRARSFPARGAGGDGRSGNNTRLASDLLNEGAITRSSDERSGKMSHTGIVRAERVDQRLRLGAIERRASNAAHELVDVGAD
jgi:hypothetical protein